MAGALMAGTLMAGALMAVMFHSSDMIIIKQRVEDAVVGL